MTSPWIRSFKASLVFTIAFAICGVLIQSSLGGGPAGPQEIHRQWEVLALGVLSGFLTSLIVWWAIVARPRKSGVARGVFAGVHCGALVHPVSWTLVSATNSLIILFGKSPRRPLGEEPLTFSHELAGVVGFSVLTFLFYGWLTVAAGALAGGVLGKWQYEPEHLDIVSEITTSQGPTGDG